MLDLRDFIRAVEAEQPDRVVHIDKPVDPADFEVTAVLQQLEDAGRNPMAIFHRPKNLFGEISRFPLVDEHLRRARALRAGPGPAGRRRRSSRCALEYGRREQQRIPPTVIPRDQAPVKQVVQVGEDADLRQFPIVRHHHMDPAPYIDMTPVMKDPDTGAYNAAYLRMMYKGPHKLGLHMSPRHNWQIAPQARGAGPADAGCRRRQPPPGVLSRRRSTSRPFGDDDYEVIGRCRASRCGWRRRETWGDDFLVPADAEIVIEGEIPPERARGRRAVRRVPGHLRPAAAALDHRRQGDHHPRGRDLPGHVRGPRRRLDEGGLPKEGADLQPHQGRRPVGQGGAPADIGRRAASTATSRSTRRSTASRKQAAFIALGEVDFDQARVRRRR